MTITRIHVRADRLGEAAVAQRRWVRVALDRLFVYDGVDLVGRDARADGGGCNVQDFSAQLGSGDCG